MSTIFDWLLPQNFLPHGHCYLWRTDVLGLHVGSDAVIAASYYAIPVALAYFVHRRRAVLPYWWVPVLFATFIFLCGTTHVLNIWTVWRPDYIVDGLVKLATAVASAGTAVLVFASLPQAMALRTPIELQAEVEARTAELRAANERLQQEIAARQQKEAALAARTDELHQTFNATATGLTRCSRNLHYVAANPAYAEIAGVPLQQIAGRSIIDVMGREGFETIRPYIERVLAGESVEYESSVPFSKGGMRVIHVAYAPWREADGSVSGWVASVTDVTARHEAEENLRTANRHKDEFLAMLAHELRNPLAPICNVGDLLERCVGPEAQKLLAILRRQTRQLTRLLDDLLDVARISKGRIDLKRETLEIGAVIDQAIETIQLAAQTRLHRLAVHKPVSPAYLEGDFARLVQSIGNILHNAAKYTEPGGAIEVKVEQSQGELTIAVRDSGIGVAPDVLPTVFDLFVQGRRGPDRAEGGLGIGLSVVKQIIELHGGSVSLESAGIGCGTTVKVHLPALVSANAAADRRAERFTAPRRRVLVVDDNEDAANSLAIMLRHEGHDVSTAYDASDALSAAEQLKPEVIFLDIGLPRMDGYEIARRLLMQHGSACPRLIALTGYGQREDRARSLEAGFAAHLTKPADIQQLQRVLSVDPDAGATGP